jgi:hypothetical protein
MRDSYFRGTETYIGYQSLNQAVCALTELVGLQRRGNANNLQPGAIRTDAIKLLLRESKNRKKRSGISWDS